MSLIIQQYGKHLSSDNDVEIYQTELFFVLLSVAITSSGR